MGNNKSIKINTKCEYHESDNTTEHFLKCPIFQKLIKEEMKAINLESVDNMQELGSLARYIEQVNEKKHDT